MPKEWNDDDVKAEIAAAIAIVREDKFEAFVRTKLASNAGDKNGGDGKSGDGGNSGGNDGTPPKGKKSLWWGESE